jgi:hypothetical protein
LIRGVEGSNTNKRATENRQRCKSVILAVFTYRT